MADSILDAFYSLGKNLNKKTGNENTPEVQEGVVSEQFPELKLDMDNDDLSALGKKWHKTWVESAVYTDWVQKGDDNEDYWLGKQFQQPKVDKRRALVDNVIFESLETYLPQVTQHNPDPVVTLDNREEETPESLAFANHLKMELGDLADALKLRLKMKKAARHWAIYLLGVAKPGWDLDNDRPGIKIIRPKRIILDPEATVDEDGYTGKYIGEHRKMEAGLMVKLLKAIDGEEGFEKIITDKVDGEMGTELGFIEWWTNDYMFWQMDTDILLKKKNPHWNYETQQEAPADPVTGQPPVDETGQSQTVTQPGINHFASAQKPYILLSVFNLGNQPVDQTSLIGQNLPTQDLINKRLKQLDKNIDSMNGGMVVSGERSGLTQQQASGVTAALRKGGTVYIPAGAVNEAVSRMSAPALPPDVYNQLGDSRSRVQFMFGVKGFQPNSGGSSASAVRSQVLNKNLDDARISGGFAEYLEQFADDIYNWFVQLLYVYDDEYANKPHPKVNITIKEGSLLPKDSGSIAAQAIQLAQSGKMSLIDLYKKLESPNPEEMAANVWLEVNAPEVLFANDPRVQQAIQAKQAAAQGAAKPPSESINYKDVPPDAKAQMLKQVGIDAHPEAIAAHDDVIHQRSKEPAIPAPVPVPQPGQ